MDERIKTLRNTLKLTQEAFGEKLGLSQNFVWMMEKGQREPSDRTIKDICRVFGCNEAWLRTGTGEPFEPKTAEDELQSLMTTLLADGSPKVKALAAVLAHTTPDEWELFAKKLCELAKEVEKQKEKSDAD